MLETLPFNKNEGNLMQPAQSCCRPAATGPACVTHQIKDCSDVIYYFYILVGNASCDLQPLG